MLISILLMVIPLLLLLLDRKEGGTSFLALAIYFTLMIIANLMSEGLVKAGSQVIQFTHFLANLLDAPLMLIAARYFTADPGIRKMLLQLSGLYLGFELVICLFILPGNQYYMICIGPGLLLVMVFALHFFIQHVKTSFNRSKDWGKAFMCGSLVFAYACFIFLYVVHYIIRYPNIPDLRRIYHLTLIIFSVSMAMGLLMISRERRRKTVVQPRVKPDQKNTFQYL